MKILIACEFSGIVRDAFIKKGFENTWSCDLLPCESDFSDNHYEGDVRDILFEDWDLIIAHPPCTYFANSGVSRLFKDDTRWLKLDNTAVFFNLFLDHPCNYIAIENPIPHKYALERIGNRKYDQIVQPYQFGHPESKKTCFWLKGLPKLEETDNVKDIFDTLPKNKQQRLFYLSPGEERSKLRSMTFPGIASAMADQWGSYVLSKQVKSRQSFYKNMPESIASDESKWITSGCF